jgi:hypothetical protein
VELIPFITFMKPTKKDGGLKVQGRLVLLLSDRYLVRGKVPIHALLATGAVWVYIGLKM